jgi:hypothetical protein
MEIAKALIIGICILLGCAIIGLSDRYEMPATKEWFYKIDKLTGRVFSFRSIGGRLDWYEMDENFKTGR